MTMYGITKTQCFQEAGFIALKSRCNFSSHWNQLIWSQQKFTYHSKICYVLSKYDHDDKHKIKVIVHKVLKKLS